MAFSASSAVLMVTKANPPGAIGHAVHYQGGFRDSAVRGERVLQVIFGGFEGEISDMQFVAHTIF